MTVLKRGMVIDVNLDPTLGSETGKIRPCVIVTNDVYNERVPVIQVVPVTEWSVKKARIMTNIEILPSPDNGLLKKSIADCLQTRPIDHSHRMVRIRGKLSPDEVQRINRSLKILFEL
ncbi:MAG: type II toxin-antitoxin system PemK/MazF family toxin [Candidatus Aegiribacteria sp.]|nr:type II toxin-antitoxin system PemK/MazF family toxin [Candidatus Aegiribacteria sp.]